MNARTHEKLQQKRAIGYIRVSSVGGRSGPEYHTLDIQRASIERVCEARGYALIDVLTDENRSGKNRKRPRFQEALERVLSGEAEAIAVWKVSRFSRNWSEAATDTELLLENSKDLISGEEGFDTTTTGGRALLRMLFVLATWEHEVLGEGWEVIKGRAVRERGSWLGVAPLGYVKGTGGVLQIDPMTAPIVREVFNRRAAGASLSELVGYLDAELPRDGGRRAFKDVRRILESRRYLGEVHWRDHVRVDAHDPLVPFDLFERANAILVDDGVHTKTRSERPFPLSSWLRCSGCGGSMGGAVDGRSKTPNYKCTHRDRCPSPVTISARIAEAWALEQSQTVSRLRPASEISGDNPRLDELLAELAFAEGEIAKLRSLKERRALGDEWLPTMTAITAEKTTIERQLASERRDGGHARTHISFEDMPEDQRYATLRGAFPAGVLVAPARGRGRNARTMQRLAFIVEDEPSTVGAS